MLYRELYHQREVYFSKIKYALLFYRDFDFRILDKIMYVTKPGKNAERISDCIMMLDTETSKSKAGEVCENHLVAWSLSIRAFHKNIVTLYGNKPSECIDCLDMICDHLPGVKHYIYIYNLSYDWVFLRKFLIKQYDVPVKQLNTKPHYPIYIEFENGLILRDALCIGQRKLEKWAADLGAEHQKAVGSWDYDLLRDQDHRFTEEELHYIENDTLAGVECIDILMQSLNKRIYSMPWTATGIPREEVRKRGKAQRGNTRFKKQLLSFQEQEIMQRWVFHGGYTHGNRLYYNETVTGTIDAYDFASSYPFVMLSEKFPAEKFTPLKNRSINDILKDKENAYFFKLILIDVELKDYMDPMPTLQFSKCEKTINVVTDNGRILSADYVEIWLTEIDLRVIASQYKYEKHICLNIYAAHKDYLPRWYTDYIFELFDAKCRLKGVDQVQYGVSKGKLNSLYGMTVQRPVPVTNEENYITGEYEVKEINKEEEYAAYCKSVNHVLNYQIGCWVTSYAFLNLYALSTCAGTWLYSDTDSCYGMEWDLDRLQQYNDIAKKKLQANGYGPAVVNNKEYWLGVAEHDGRYSEFRCLHSKCYAVRDMESGKLKITVAGVPKNGVEVLKDDINNFRPGCVFPGTVTGKKTYTYFFKDKIEIDKNGNEVGDSIDLSPCDYLLDAEFSFENITEDIEVPFYE